jgi:hypothetical protein
VTTGKITDSAYNGRVEKFLNELVWMAHSKSEVRDGEGAIPHCI